MSDFHLGDRVIAVVTASGIFDMDSPCIVKGNVYEVRRLDSYHANGQAPQRTIVMKECHTRKKEKCVCQITGWPHYYFDLANDKFTEEEAAKAQTLPSPVDVADFLLRRV